MLSAHLDSRFIIFEIMKVTGTSLIYGYVKFYKFCLI